MDKIENLPETKGTERKKPVDVPEIQLIVFRQNGELYGIRIEQVREVTHSPVISKFPKSPSFIKGVANIRGDIISMIDVEERLGLERALSLKDDTGKYTVVIERDDLMVGLLVDDVPFSLTVPESSIDKAGDIIEHTRISENFIQGIAKHQNQLIIIIDIENFIIY